MLPAPDDTLPTRSSLLERVRDAQDRTGWEEFFRAYRGLVYGFALKSGLAEAEAEDVVQTTMTSVVEALPGYQYEPERCRFKSWLLLLAGRRIVDFKRQKTREPSAVVNTPSPPGSEVGLQPLPDPERPELEALWEAEWHRHVLETATEKLRRLAEPAHFQIFYLHVLKEQPAREVARTLGVRLGQVYLVSHRLRRDFKMAVEAERKRG